MKISGSYDIPAPPDIVWEGLNDPDLLGHCIEGCEKIEKLSDTEFTATVRAKIGPVSARFKGKIVLEDRKPPVSYRIVGKGTGGVAGFAEGTANVTLTPIDIGTRLTYVADAKIGGKLAQIGSRVITAVVDKLSGRFFSAFSERVVSDFSASGIENGSAHTTVPAPSDPTSDGKDTDGRVPASGEALSAKEERETPVQSSSSPKKTNVTGRILAGLIAAFGAYLIYRFTR